MDDFRSRSYVEGGRMQMEAYGSRTAPPYGLHDFRCYSASYASWPSTEQAQLPREIKLKKGKSVSGSSSSSGRWGFKDPELQRRKRVAGYKLYSVEGRMKGSLRSSFRWLKDRYTQVLYGWW